MNKDFFAIVPARGGSKGIPNKNMVELGGIPLIQHTINAIKESKIEDFVVTTDSESIIKYCESNNYNYVVRPTDLAQDDSKAIDVVNHVTKQLKKQYEYIVYLQPTSPFRNYKHINKAIELVLNDPSADSLVSVVKVPHNFIPESIMELNGKYLNEFSNDKIYQRQFKPTYYARNGAAIYVTKRKRLKDYIFGGKILCLEMDKFESIDIDEYCDLELASMYLKLKNGKK